MKITLATVALLGVLTTGIANADDTTPIRRAHMRDVTASPTFGGGDVPMKLSNLWDGIAFSSWAGANNPDGIWLKIQFAGTRYIQRIQVLPGCAGSGRVFAEYRVPKQLVLKADDRTVTIDVAYRRKMQTYQIDPPLRASSLEILAPSSYPGRQPAVCLTELQLHEQRALGKLDPQTRAKLERAARALSNANDSSAVTALVSMGPAAVPRLTFALEEKDPLVQKRALQALHRIGAPSGAKALIRYWKAGPGPDLRELAFRAMARTGHDAVIPLIAEVMQDDDQALADIAANTVASYGNAMLPAIEPLLKSPYADVQERAVRAMQYIGDIRVVDLARPFCSARRSGHRAAAAKAIAASPCDAATEELLKLAHDPHPHVRHAVAEALVDYPDGEAQLILAELLRDADSYVAHKALDVLAAKPDGAKHLATYISAEHAPLGNEAIMMLAQSGSQLATRVMVDALRRGDARFRHSLQAGILAVGRDAVSNLVHAAITDDNLRSDAEKVLAQDPEMASSLVGEIADRELGRTPLFLLRALGKTRRADALAVLDRVWEASPPSVRLQIIRAWSNFPAAGVKTRLMNAIETADSLSRVEAVRAAAEAGVTEVGPVLARALDDGSLPPAVAIEGLGKLESEAGVEYMVKNFRFADMATRLAILHACERIQSRECLELLFTATRDKNATIRHEALRLLSSD